jgi:hypothetical protein
LRAGCISRGENGTVAAARNTNTNCSSANSMRSIDFERKPLHSWACYGENPTAESGSYFLCKHLSETASNSGSLLSLHISFDFHIPASEAASSRATLIRWMDSC